MHRCGSATKDFGCREAVEAARLWYEDEIEKRISSKPITVSEACQEYLDDVRVREDETRKNPERSYMDARWRIRKYVDAELLGQIVLKDLRETDLRKWWNKLDRTKNDQGKTLSKASQNRTLTVLHAALNIAVRDRRVSSDLAVEWKAVKKHRKPGRAHDVYLTVKQCNTLFDACEGNFADYVRAVTLTGCRPGDPALVRREDFTGKANLFRTKVAPLQGPLSADARVLFRKLAKDKTPKALLFVKDDGSPYENRIDWARALRGAARKALPGDMKDAAVMRSLRHSFIMDCLTAGMPAIEVAAICRTSIEMLEDNYWRLIQPNLEDRLNDVKML